MRLEYWSASRRPYCSRAVAGEYRRDPDQPGGAESDYQRRPGHAEGGLINIALKNAVVELGDGSPLDPGHYVRCSIADNGPGIGEEDLHRIFDPYFTTGELGQAILRVLK